MVGLAIFSRGLLLVIRVCNSHELVPGNHRMEHSNLGMTVGKTLAYTSVQFYNSKGQLAARGSHTKYSILPISLS